jgi:CheY-like chemotaxis protein
MIAERNGYMCVSASSAAEARAVLNGSHAVEMVMTEQQMPEMTGLELYSVGPADIRFRQLPFILCTGFADRVTIAEAMRLGIRHIIVKPITSRVVMDKITAVEAERPPVTEPTGARMARLGMTDVELRAFVRASWAQVSGMRDDLSRAHANGDRVTAILVAQRLRESAEQLGAPRLLAAVEALQGTQTWHDLEEAVVIVLHEIGALEDAVGA